MLTAIVVEYKSYEATFEYVIRLINNIENEDVIHIVVVDNSNDEINYRNLVKCFKQSIDFSIKTDYEASDLIYAYTANKLVSCEVKLYKNGNNDGYGKGNNIGVELAVSTWGDLGILLFTNNDISFKNKIDMAIIKGLFKNNPSVALVGPRIVGLDNEVQSPYKKCSLWERWIKVGLLWPLNKVIKMVKFSDVDLSPQNYSGIVCRVMGSFFFADSNAFTKVRGFDENTFLYAEELILSEKMRLIGKETYYYNDFVVIHEHSKIISQFHTSKEKLKLRFRSELYYYEKYCDASKCESILSIFAFELYLIKLSCWNFVKIRLKGKKNK